MAEPPPVPRTRLYIEHIGGPLLGHVGRYVDKADSTTRVGIDICESAYWGRGLGTEALRTGSECLKRGRQGNELMAS